MHRAFRLALVTIPLLLGCDRPGAPQAESRTGLAPASVTPATAAEADSPLRGDVRTAVLGKVAPDFVLEGLDGNELSLSALRGKIVVLEWFNPECPFVNAAHTKGSLNGLAAAHQKSGVVWLAINSGAPGKQGHGIDKNKAGKAKYNLSHPILLDETGAVGKAYGAERTPHLFVVDAQGLLVYAGAVDNSPDGERESPQGDHLINYVDDSLADLASGRPVKIPSTEAYGCSVKYGGA